MRDIVIIDSDCNSRRKWISTSLRPITSQIEASNNPEMRIERNYPTINLITKSRPGNLFSTLNPEPQTIEVEDKRLL